MVHTFVSHIWHIPSFLMTWLIFLSKSTVKVLIFTNVSFSASECREWLIHFSVPVLYGQLNADAFVHYTLLVTAMAILTNDNILETDVDYAEQLLVDFCRLFPAIYGIFFGNYVKNKNTFII